MTETVRRHVRAYVSVPVEGTSYQEMDAKARRYAARYFEVGEEDLIVTTTPTATVVATAKFSDDPTEPDRWRGTFRVGCLHPFGPDDHIPGPEFPDEDEDQEDADAD